jgi:hypothetical protein
LCEELEKKNAERESDEEKRYKKKKEEIFCREN